MKIGENRENVWKNYNLDKTAYNLFELRHNNLPLTKESFFAFKVAKWCLHELMWSAQIPNKW